MRKLGLALVMIVAACGGKSSGGGTTTQGGGDDDVGDDEGGGGDDGTGDEIIPGERMDEITQILDRKRNSSGTRCIERAIDNGELKKNARGVLAVNFVINEAGKVKDIEVTQNAFEESPMMTECIMELLHNIEFGSLPRDLPWSYKFRFEAF